MARLLSSERISLRWFEDGFGAFHSSQWKAVMSRPLLVHLLYAVAGVATAALPYWLFPLSS
jgi:hypothetical protein